nr:winged helix DNA-binding domain-containing protein [Actinokineospora enzanensis]
MRHIGTAARRARLGHRHRLAAETRAADPVTAADAVVALHGTDPTSVHLSALARMTGGDISAIGDALYTDRALIRLLGMRRTVFVASHSNASLIQAGCSLGVAARERRKLEKMLDGVVPDPPTWLAETGEVALAALRARGETTAADLATDHPRLSTQVVLSQGKDYEGRQNIASRLLFLLAAEGHVVRARPRGSWTSHQYRWSPLRSWLPDGLEDWDQPKAEAELARRWLHAFGPALPDDLQWWTGWTKTQTRRALSAVDIAEVELDEGVGVLLTADEDEPPALEPWAALLPALDPTTMGWQRRDWYLGAHATRLFDKFGNAGPTLWWNGQVVGGWAQRADGEIVWRFLEDVDSAAEAAVAQAAERWVSVLGDVRLSARARGRTALEQELIA